MLIMAGGTESIAYLGPTDLQSLVDFVNDETGRPKKVKDINSSLRNSLISEV